MTPVGVRTDEHATIGRLKVPARHGTVRPHGRRERAGASYAGMRYKRAVEKLRILAEACERVKVFWFDTEPFLKAVYAFGEVIDGADPLDKGGFMYFWRSHLDPI